MTSFMIEPDLLVRVDERARETDRSRSWTINELIRTGLGPTRRPSLQAELDELERTDPDVRAAARSYDRMVERITDPGDYRRVPAEEDAGA